MNNEQRAEATIQKYGFDFHNIPKDEIISLILSEINDFHPGSSEYIRVLCGYLYCIGDHSDADLIRRAKYEISFDVGCMIDIEWIDSLEENINTNYTVRPREEIIAEFISYYQDYEADDWDW